MVALVFLVVLALVFAVVWINLAKNPHPRARLGPDGTNVREPETFLVHHEGKGQGLDIANTALKERTEDVRRDLPGEAHKVRAPIPGREMVHMADAPPTDISKYGDEKVAPGATPGFAGAEPKEKVLKEGPVGSRPETPEEPGSPYAMGRRVTDIHRDMELAAEALPNVSPGQKRRLDRTLAVSPSTNGTEPGYGLGRTAPDGSDGEFGHDRPDNPNSYENSIPRRTDTEERGKVVLFRSRIGDQTANAEVTFRPDPDLGFETAGELEWTHLHEDVPPLPEAYGEDTVVAMVRNPRSLYVYWEANGFGDENLRTMLGEDGWHRTAPVLRLFDVTAGAYPGQPGGHTFAIELNEHDDHYFINEGIQPGHRYVVSYERHTQDGQYYMISHSGPVTMPHDGPAEAGELYQLYGRQPGEWSGSPWR